MTQRMTLLMTRPYTASIRFVEQLPATVRDRLNVCYAPLIQIAPIVDQIPLGDAKALVFTSANAVGLASALIQDRTLPVYSVGKATTHAAKDAGWTASFSGATADDLIETLTAIQPSGPLLHLCGVHTRGAIPERLTAAGIRTTSIHIYDQITESLTEQAIEVLNGSIPVFAPLFSPRTARQFANQTVIRAPLWLATLSNEVSKPLKSLRYQRLLTCDHPDLATMIQCVENLVNTADRVERDQSAK